MAISEIWTLKRSSDDTEQTLSAWGIGSASVVATNQRADVFSFVVLPEFYTDAEAFAFEETLDLYRDGTRFFSGLVQTTPLSSEPSKSEHSYTVVGPWQALEDLPFAQTWNSYDSSLSAKADKLHSRILLGYRGDRWVSVRDILTELITYAALRGVDVAMGDVPEGLYVPPISTHSSRVGTLIKDVLYWLHDWTVWFDYEAAVPTFNIAQRAKAAVVSFNATGKPLSAVPKVTKRADLVPSNVILSYETDVEDPDGDADVVTQRRRLLSIYRDVFPDDTIGRRTLLETLPIQTSGLPLTEPTDAQSKVHHEAVLTRVLPRTGARDDVAKTWWLDHLGLSRFGLTKDHVELAVRDEDPDVWRHTLALNPIDVPEPPKVINPNATAVFKTTTLKDLPNELVEGALPDWIDKLKAMRVRCRATVAVHKSVVDALRPIFKNDIVEQLSQREGIANGVACYFIQGDIEVRGTNADSKVYSKVVSYEPGAPGADPEEERKRKVKSQKEQIVPNLAETIFKSLTPAFYEGDIELTERQGGSRQYVGRVLNLKSDARPEWGSMRALIQSAKLDLKTNKTRVSFGFPKQLRVYDWKTLMAGPRAVERSAQDTRPVAEIVTAFSQGTNDHRDDREEEKNGVFGSVLGPVNIGGAMGAGNSIGLRGFQLSSVSGDATRGRIYGSVLSGLFIGVPNVSSGDDIVAGVWREFGISEGLNAVWLEVGFDPLSEEVLALSADDGDRTVYAMLNGGEEVTCELKVGAAFPLNDDVVHPKISAASGEVTVRAKYYVELGTITKTGAAVNAANIRYGPGHVEFCAPSNFRPTFLT